MTIIYKLFFSICFIFLIILETNSIAQTDTRPFKIYLEAIKQYKENHPDTAVKLFFTVLNSRYKIYTKNKDKIDTDIIKNVILKHAEHLYYLKNYDKAQNILNQLLTFYSDINVYNLTAYTELRLNHIKLAENLFNKTLNIEPENVSALKGLEEIEVLKADINKKAKHTEMMENYEQAEINFSLKKYEEALILYKKLIEGFPDRNIYQINQARRRINEINNIFKKNKIDSVLETIKNTDPKNTVINLTLYKELIKLDPKEISHRIDFTNYIIRNLSDKKKIYETDTGIISLFFDVISPISEETKYALINRFYSELIKKGSYDKAKEMIRKCRSEGLNIKLIHQLEQQLNIHRYRFIFFILALIVLVVLVKTIKNLKFIKFKNHFLLFLSKLTGDYVRQIDCLKNLIEIDPQNLNYKKMLLETYFTNNINTSFCELYLKIKDTGIDITIEMLMKLVDIFIKRKEFDNALEVVNRLDSIVISDVMKLALDKYKFTIYKNLNDTENLGRISENILRNVFDVDVIKTSIEADLKNNDEKSSVRSVHNWIHTNPSSIKDITAFLETLIINHPDAYRIMRLLAALYKKTGLTDKAIDLYEKILPHHNIKLPLYNELVKLYIKKDNFLKAYNSQKEIIKLRKNELQDKVKLAELSFKLNKYDETIMLYSDILKVDRDNLAAINTLKTLSEMYYNNKEFSKSINLLETIVTNTFVEVPEIELSLGRLYIETGEYNKSIKILQNIQAGDINIRYRALLLVGKALINKGNYRLALDTFNKIDNSSIGLNIEVKKMIYYFKGIAYEKLNKYDEAMKNYHDLMLIDINYKDIKEKYEHLAKSSS